MRIRWHSIPENRLKIAIKQARERLRGTDVPVTITVKDLLPLPSYCPVLGIEIRYCQGKIGFIDHSPSMDRIVPRLGYVPGNVRIISWRANRLKQDATLDELLAIVSYIKGER